MKISVSLTLLLIHAGFSWCCFAGTPLKDQSLTNPVKDADSSLIIYPATPNAIASDQYVIKFNGRKGFVEKMPRFDVPIHYARIAYDGKRPLAIEIKTPQPVSSYVISPQAKSIKGIVIGNTLRFSVNEAGYLAVRINDGEYLFLLIDSPEQHMVKLHDAGVKNILDYGIDRTGKKLETAKLQKAIDEASARPAGSILYFPKGQYLTGQLNVKSNVNIYLEPGAVIKGSTQVTDYSESLLRFDNVKNISITGHGTIDGSGWDGLRKNGGKGFYLLYLSLCNNVLIDGPVLRDPCFWNTRVFRSSDIHLRNLKIMNNCPKLDWTNTDGVDFDSSSDCDLINSVMHTGDDNVVVKGLDTTGQFNTERIRFEKILGISNSAAAKIGTETCVKYFRDVEFKDIDIIRCKRAIVISGFDSSNIENIRFSGIRVEEVIFPGKEVPRVIDIEVTNNSWRECVGRCRISDITIDNLKTYFPLKDVQSNIQGQSTDFGIKGVAIKNFSTPDRVVNSIEDGNIMTNGFVTGLTFTSSEKK